MYETKTECVSEPRTEEIECAPNVERLDFSVSVQAFKTLVNELVVLADECKITINPIDGLTVRLVDPAHIAMIDTGMAIELFDSWRVYPTNAYIGSFGIDLEKLKTYLKQFKVRDNDTILSVSVLMSGSARTMTIEGPTGSRVLSLIDDSGMSDPKLPNLDLPSEIVIKDAKLFRNALKMAEEISDYIALEFDAQDKALWLKCEGDTDKMASKLEVEVIRSEIRTVFKNVDGERVQIKTPNATSLYPLEYLTKMAKGLPDGFRICLGFDYPVKIAYGKTVKLLAPRIESND